MHRWLHEAGQSTVARMFSISKVSHALLAGKKHCYVVFFENTTQAFPSRVRTCRVDEWMISLKDTFLQIDYPLASLVCEDAGMDLT